MEFKIINKAEEISLVVLTGTINEDSYLELQKVQHALEESACTTVVFDFSQTTSINSLGVRGWIQFIRAVEGAGKSVQFEACSPEVVMQINMVPNFLSQARVVSFYANYVCESCSTNRSLLIQSADLVSTTIPARPTCPACNSEMESEQLEDEYFAFLSK